MVDFVPGYSRIQDTNPAGSVFGPMMDEILAKGAAKHITTLSANTGVGLSGHGRSYNLAGWTLTLDPASVLTTGWYAFARGPGIIDPDDGASVTLMAGEWALIGTNGTTTYIDRAGVSSQMITKITDETTNTDVTLSNDAKLLFPVLANTKYWFKFRIHYDTPTAADFKFDINGPGTPTLVDYITKVFAPGSVSPVHTRQTAFAVSIQVLETSGTRGYIEVDGILHNGANAGNVTFRWAQDTSNASNTTVRAGSRVEFGIAQ